MAGHWPKGAREINDENDRDPRSGRRLGPQTRPIAILAKIGHEGGEIMSEASRLKKAQEQR